MSGDRRLMALNHQLSTINSQPSTRFRVAHPLSRSAARARRAAVYQHKRPSARRSGFARGKSATLFTFGNGNLYLGGAAAGIEKPQRRRTARGGI
jgi:hypothetical protein